VDYYNNLVVTVPIDFEMGVVVVLDNKAVDHY